MALKRGPAPLGPALQALAGAARGAIVPLVLLVLWEAAARSGVVPPIVLPAPSAVARKWWEGLRPAAPFTGETTRMTWWLSGELVHDAASSVFRVLTGFLVGAGLGLPLGIVMGASRRVHDLFNPLVQVLRPIPPIAFIPLAILWFGLGNPPAVFLIALGAFFPVLMNATAGVRHVDAIYVRAAQNLGAGRAVLFRRIILPAALPHVLTGLRVGMGTAFIVVIVSEMIAVNDGLGYRILEAREFMWSDKIVAGMLTIGLIGLCIDWGMSRINRHLLRWHRGIES